MDFERRERFARHIDLTALVDIVFHLMVFFMLTTSFVVAESMELTLPSAKPITATAVAPTEFTRIVVRPGGGLLVGNIPVTGEQLQSMLITSLAKQPNAKIVILSTPGVLVQELVAVLDMVYFAGGVNVQVDKGFV